MEPFPVTLKLALGDLLVVPVSKDFISMDLVEGKEFLLDNVSCTALSTMTVTMHLQVEKLESSPFQIILGDITCLFTVAGSFVFSMTWLMLFQ